MYSPVCMKTMSSFGRFHGLAACLLLLPLIGSYAQTSANTDGIPVVALVATDNHATWAGDTGTFTFLRSGNLTPALNVYYCISGTATNGVDYHSIGNWLQIPSGVSSNTVVITPLDSGQMDTRTVVLELCASPLMSPVNYYMSDSHDKGTVYITSADVTNLPPEVSLIGPTNGASFFAPANILLVAKAADPDGSVTNVEFFANNVDLGPASSLLALDPLGTNGKVGPVYVLPWTNVAIGDYALTVVATDNGGSSTTSLPVKISVVEVPPPTNHPPVVELIHPANGATFDAPANITLLARASDIDGTVSNVEFYANDADLGAGSAVVLDPPGIDGKTGLVYLLSWTNVSEGDYALTAMATDNEGASTTSNPAKISVVITPPPTNHPPLVHITSPPDGTTLRGPLNIPLFAYARDPDGSVSSVEFFDGDTSLGLARPVKSILPLPIATPEMPVDIVRPTNQWELIWSNAPVGLHVLTAVATDNSNALTTSDPVKLTILSLPPPPTNRPPVISIVASDPVAIEGTNTWPWRCLSNASPSWADWDDPNATFCYRTNVGPKNAYFTVHRHGATNDDVTVAYEIGGTATNGVDYDLLPGVVTIPAGERSAMISVVPIDDGPPDITSTVRLALVADTNSPPAYVLGRPQRAVAIILDGPLTRHGGGLLSDHHFHVSVPGPNGAWCHVDYSSDLTNWTPVCTNQVINGMVDFVDPDGVTSGGRFYRVVPEANPPDE